MTVYNSGPFNIEQNNSAYFAVEFLDSSGSLTVPSAATLTVAYTNTSNAAQTDTITLTQTNSFFTGTWPSTSAALGLAIWNAYTTGNSTSQAIGQLRVIQRQSTI